MINRIIDLSQRAAQLLDIERPGTAPVLVEIIPGESQRLVAIAQGKAPPADDTDLPEAAPVEGVQTKALGGATPASPTAPGVPQAPSPPQTASTPPAAAAPVPWPSEQVQQVSVQPTQLYIQAGSFTSPSNAESLRQRLQAFGPAFVEAARIGTQDFYRVRVGPIASVSEADSVLSRMIAGGYTESHIVVD